MSQNDGDIGICTAALHHAQMIINGVASIDAWQVLEGDVGSRKKNIVAKNIISRIAWLLATSASGGVQTTLLKEQSGYDQISPNGMSAQNDA